VDGRRAVARLRESLLCRGRQDERAGVLRQANVLLFGSLASLSGREQTAVSLSLETSTLERLEVEIKVRLGKVTALRRFGAILVSRGASLHSTLQRERDSRGPGCERAPLSGSTRPHLRLGPPGALTALSHVQRTSDCLACARGRKPRSRARQATRPDAPRPQELSRPGSRTLLRRPGRLAHCPTRPGLRFSLLSAVPRTRTDMTGRRQAALPRRAVTSGRRTLLRRRGRLAQSPTRPDLRFSRLEAGFRARTDTMKRRHTALGLTVPIGVSERPDKRWRGRKAMGRRSGGG